MTSANTTTPSTATNQSASAAAKVGRDVSIDFLRGLVMVLMVLDHARDFFYGFRDDPTDLATTTPVLFTTRFVTHFCAPVFVLLSGTAAYLHGRRGSGPALRRFLVTRGFVLIALELTVVRLGWIPDPGYHLTPLQVIWAIGWSMVALAPLTRLPLPWLVAISAVVIAGHDLFDGVRADQLGAWDWLWHVLHEPGMLQLAPGHAFWVLYPLVPWIFVMAMGYALGAIVVLPPEPRRGQLRAIGLALIAVFVALRALNVYGDPVPWSAQRSWAFTIMSFLNCEKYPPSLLYLAMTLGPSLLLLAYAPARADSSIVRVLVTFGRVPLLFYVTHLFLLRYSAIPISYLRFGADAFTPPPRGIAGSAELGLWAAYAAWAAALVLLYPLCRRYAALKATRTDAWLRYL